MNDGINDNITFSHNAGNNTIGLQYNNDMQVVLDYIDCYLKTKVLQKRIHDHLLKFWTSKNLIMDKYDILMKWIYASDHERLHLKSDKYLFLTLFERSKSFENMANSLRRIEGSKTLIMEFINTF